MDKEVETSGGKKKKKPRNHRDEKYSNKLKNSIKGFKSRLENAEELVRWRIRYLKLSYQMNKKKNKKE